MKVIIYLFLIFVGINTLVSQSVDVELRMHPEINKLEFNNDPRILLLENDKYRFTLFDPYSRSLIETNENNLVFAGENSMDTYWFWYPHTKTSYLYRSSRSSNNESPSGWFKLVWNSEKAMVEAELQSGWGGIIYSPPIVKMSDSRYEMISSFKRNKAVGNQRHDYTQRIIIRDVETGKVYLDNFLRARYDTSYNYLWIGGTLILEGKTVGFLTRNPKSAPAPESIKSLWDLDIRVNTSLYDFASGYYVSFYPHIIIGYGAGYIITTGSDFIGLRIWDLSGKLVYSDEDNTLFWQKITTTGNLLLGLSYFDNPFVYIYFQDAYYPTWEQYFIINLQTNEVTVLGSDEFESIVTISGVIHMK